ncbi:hypothetical protein Tco_1024325, partial [Tanacetum coccineum]
SVEAGFHPGLLTCMRPFPVLPLPHMALPTWDLIFMYLPTRLASLLRYTKSPGLKLTLRTLEL